GTYDPRDEAPHNCIVFKGFQTPEELARLYAAADFAVFPFEEISTSGSMMEALSFGVPVIAPDHPWVCNVVRNGHEGFVYPLAGVGGLLAAVETALVTPAWRREAMAAAASATAALYRPDEFAAQFAQVIERVLAGARRKPRSRAASRLR